MVEAVRRLDAAGLEPAAMTVREPSLDDVFLELTGKPSEPDLDEAGQRIGSGAMTASTITPAVPIRRLSGAAHGDH